MSAVLRWLFLIPTLIICHVTPYQAQPVLSLPSQVPFYMALENLWHKRAKQPDESLRGEEIFEVT